MLSRTHRNDLELEALAVATPARRYLDVVEAGLFQQDAHAVGTEQIVVVVTFIVLCAVKDFAEIREGIGALPGCFDHRRRVRGHGMEGSPLAKQVAPVW